MASFKNSSSFYFVNPKGKAEQVQLMKTFDPFLMIESFSGKIELPLPIVGEVALEGRVRGILE